MKLIETKYKDTKFLTIKNNKDLEITFSTRGASVYSIKYKNDYVTFHPEEKDDFLTSTKFYGKSLGRTCGRLKDGIITVEGIEYKLEKNENNKTTLHGGFNNISFKEFEYVSNENDELFNIIFKYNSKHLEAGYPGNVSFLVVYSILKDKNKFLIHYHCFSDRVTPINMSTHIYWRLKGEDILNHELYVDADELVTSNKDTQVNIGKEKVNNLFDFRISKKIKKDIFELAKIDPKSNGYDHGWIFKNNNDEPKVILKNEDLSLLIRTDMNMVNIYTNCYPNGKSIKQYGVDNLYGGIAIEPQMYFTSCDNILISKDKPYDHFISFELEENK